MKDWCNAEYWWVFLDWVEDRTKHRLEMNTRKTWGSNVMHIADVHCTRHSTSSTATRMGLQSTSIQVMMVMMVVVVVLYHWYSSDGMELVQCVPLVQKRRWGKTPNFLFSFASILLQQPIGHPSQSLQPSPSLHTISPAISISNLLCFLPISLVTVLGQSTSFIHKSG